MAKIKTEQLETLVAADVSDFDTEVANNSAVTANTAKVTNADQTAAQVPFTPAGNIAATDVQAAIQELDTEKGTGDVSKVGTPVDNQIGVWTGDGTIEGDANFTFDGVDLILKDGIDMVIGHTNHVTIGNNSAMQILGTSAADTSLTIGRWTATTATSPNLRFFKSRNPVIGSNTIVIDSSRVGEISYYADDGVDNNTEIANSFVEVDDTSPAAGDIGAAYVWNSMSGGGTASTEKMRLAADGTLTVGGNEVIDASDTNYVKLAAVTATATELNVLDGITATTAELNYTDGVTSNIQTQLNAKAPTASPTLTGTTTVDRIDYDQGVGTVSALGNLGATETIDWATATHFSGNLDSNITFTNSNSVTGQSITLYLTYSGAQRTITWPTTTWLDNATGAAPTAPAASGNVLVVTLQNIGGTIYGSATGDYAVYA